MHTSERNVIGIYTFYIRPAPARRVFKLRGCHNVWYIYLTLWQQRERKRERETLKENTKKTIARHFRRIKRAIFWPSDLAKILDVNRVRWEAWNLSAPKMADFLGGANLLKRADFTSQKYPSI